MQNDSHKIAAQNRAEGDKVGGPYQTPGLRKATRMTVFLSIVTLTAFGVPAGIAIANWQKGNHWTAFGWGILAYILFGIGAGFTYYYAVIKAAKTVRSAQSAKDRPE